MEDGDPTRANAATRHHMVDLRYALHCFTDNRELVKWSVYGICGALSLAYFLVDLRRNLVMAESRFPRENLDALARLGWTGVLQLRQEILRAVRLLPPLDRRAD